MSNNEFEKIKTRVGKEFPFYLKILDEFSVYYRENIDSSIKIYFHDDDETMMNVSEFVKQHIDKYNELKYDNPSNKSIFKFDELHKNIDTIYGIITEIGKKKKTMNVNCVSDSLFAIVLELINLKRENPNEKYKIVNF